MAMFVASAGFFASCGDDLTTAPTVTVNELAGNDYVQGTQVSYSVQISATDAELASFKVTASVADGVSGSATLLDTIFAKNVTTASFTIRYNVPTSNTGAVTLTFAATDDTPSTTSETATFTIVEATVSTPFPATVLTGDVSHRWGAAQGGWNMDTNTGVSMGASQAQGWAGADIVHGTSATADGATFVANFSRGYQSNTTFVKLEGANFATTDMETVIAALDANGVTEISAAAVVGDLFGIHMNNGEFAIMRIDAISTTANASKGGVGHFTFSFKKGEAPAAK